MNAEIFAEWLRRQGYQVFRSESSYWFDNAPHVFQAFPYNWLISPAESEVEALLRSNRGIALRYSCPITPSKGMLSFHVVCNDRSYSLEKLTRTARRNTQKGLQNCKVSRIPFQQLAEDGWRMHLETCQRQGGWKEMSKKKWSQRCLSASDLEGFEAWGVFVGDELGASLLAARIDDCMLILHQQSRVDLLHMRVNNALTFSVTKEMINRPGIVQVHYGVRSLNAPLSVEAYKIRMGYTALPVRQRVALHPWASALGGPLTYRFLSWLLHKGPESPTLAKMDGMLRIHVGSEFSESSEQNSELEALEEECYGKKYLQQTERGRIFNVQE